MPNFHTLRERTPHRDVFGWAGCFGESVNCQISTQGRRLAAPLNEPQLEAVSMSANNGGRMRPAALLSVCFLSLVAIGHLVRVLVGASLVVEGVTLPMWPSYLAVGCAGGLAVLLWREQQRARPSS